MKLHRLLVLGFILLTAALNAQTDFRPGYIITTKGDTVQGKVDYRSDMIMCSTCKFKDEAGTVTKYKPSDIAAYRFIDGKFYESKEVKNKEVFLECLIKGEVNFYYLRDLDGDTYYIDKEGEKLSELPFKKEIVTVKGQDKMYKSTKHIGILQYYMKDAPDFQQKIKAVEEVDHKALILLGESYHNTVCDEEKCIIYEKPKPSFKIIPEIVVGAIDFAEDQYELNLQTGIITHIWLPRLNERVYIRTGLLYAEQKPIEYSSKAQRDKIISLLKIPVQIEYIYPSGTIRPRLAYGINYYRPNNHSVSLNLGTNIRLSDTFHLSATTDLECKPVMVLLPKKGFAYSFHAGLFINL